MSNGVSPTSAPSSQQHTPSMISSYSYITTLDKQYSEPAGQRIMLLIKLNANCCIAGGVETILKLGKQNKKAGGGSLVPSGAAPGTGQLESDASDTTSNTSNGSDPFGFLNADSAIDTNGMTDSSTGSKKKGAHHKIGGFLKKVAKSTTSNLERGIHGLAIKADGGKNPDLLFVGLYDAGELVSLTEGVALPVMEHERLQGCTFRIPITVPPNTPNMTTLELKVYIRSGAALLQSTKSAKHYLLGTVPVSVSQLQQVVMQQKSNNSALSPPPTFLNLALNSNIVVDGQMQVAIFADKKFPPLTGRGWALTDPDMNGYALSGLYHLPLDQSYVFSSQSKSLSYLATERAIESTIVLPIATAYAKMCQDACRISLQHATTVAQSLLTNRHDSPSPQTKASCDLKIGYLLLSAEYVNRQASAASLSVIWQRPDSIFEVELVGNARLPLQTLAVGFAPTISTMIFPPLVAFDRVLPALKVQYGGDASTPPPSFLIGKIVLRVRLSLPTFSGGGSSASDPIGSGSKTVSAAEEVWHAVLDLEQYIQQQATRAPISVPIYHPATGTQAGTVVLQLQVMLPPGGGSNLARSPVTSSLGGLVSLVGLDTLLEDNDTNPILDWDLSSSKPVTDPAQQRRKNQLTTMGSFVAHAYLQQQIQNFRSRDMAAIEDRYGKYRTALSYNPQGDVLPSAEDKTPKPFRPSSSRVTETLSGIPFNVHNHTLTIEQVDQPQHGILFHNITHGAPADHARGFSNLVAPDNGTNGATNSPVGPVSGGLRRLEAKRVELAKAVVDAQSALIGAVANHFVAARQSQNYTHHISARDVTTASLRWNVFEAAQALHHVTWACAARRANVFSQTLGIAMSSYLSSVSDKSKVETGWPDLWLRHGFLITFEGLLSAAGKELGMIEDASIGISMLRMVSVAFVADDSASGASVEGRVMIPNSPYLKWIGLSAAGVGSATQYRLNIGVDTQYYTQCIPEPLKNGQAVRFYPLLFQVGVDIRQWGANKQKNARSQFGTMESEVEPPAGGLIDDEEDDVGVADNDVLVQLNFEALRKMNSYAFMISPLQSASSGEIDPTGNPANMQVHPSLKTLHEHILASANKVNHSILDDAAAACQTLGGGSTVFCKSGKDRTAMHVTFKSAQFVHGFLQRTGAGPPIIQPSTVYDDATMMRIHGTRLPICEKNVGHCRYAFNSLQVQFMPDMLKPPPSTLAGFLKGGRVFGPGGIES